MADQKLVIGMDVGGTKTRASLVNDKGECLGQGLGGSGNINFVTLEQGEESFTKAITDAQKMAGIKSLETEIVVVGIEPDPAALHPCINRVAKPKQIQHHKEGECSMVGGLIEKVGLSLIAGTGSVGWGRNKNGDTHVTSCWGTIGDEGSAYDLARRGVNAAFWAEDGRGDKTKLVDNLVAHFRTLYPDTKIEKMIDVVSPIYQNPDVRKNFAALSRIVMKTALDGDPVAVKVIEEGADQIAHLLATCARVLGMEKDPYRIAATGGLVEDKGWYYQLVEARLAKIHPQAKLVLPKFPPVIGAALIALDEIGVEWTDKVVANLEKTVPNTKAE